MRIQNYKDFIKNELMAQDFINHLDLPVLESSDDDSYKSAEKKIISDLKLNFKLVFTFGAGIGALYPIVEKLLRNMSIDSIQINKENIVLLTIAAITITYIEEKKSRSSQEEEELTKDSKSMLEELKMRGIGNGLVKKTMKAIQACKSIFSTISKHLGAVVGGVIDMFAYTSILIPVMNAILFVIGKYDFNLESLAQNFLGLTLGIGSIVAKHGIIEILNKIKNKFSISNKEVIDEIETPVIQKFASFGDSKPEKPKEGEMINEQ